MKFEWMNVNAVHCSICTLWSLRLDVFFLLLLLLVRGFFFSFWKWISMWMRLTEITFWCAMHNWMLFRELLIFVLRGWDRKFRLLQQDITYYLHHDSRCLYVCILRTSHRQRENHFWIAIYFFPRVYEWNGPKCHSKTRTQKIFSICILNLLDVESTQCGFFVRPIDKHKTMSFWILECENTFWKIYIDPNHRPNHPINRSCIWNTFIVLFFLYIFFLLFCCLDMNWILIEWF